MNNLSRNLPTALIVGAAGFLGSHLVKAFLDKNIQVIGVDDLSSGRVENLYSVTNNPKFVFHKKSALDLEEIGLEKVDYAIFAISDSLPEGLYKENLEAFLSVLKDKKSKILYISSLNLYDGKSSLYPNLKSGEKVLAKISQDEKLNARVARLASVYGVGMKLIGGDPVIRLLQAVLEGDLLKESSSMEFSSRALYIDDAVNLLLKTLFHGATSGKIFDGALLHPYKVSEIKQVMLDPSWYEEKGFVPEVLPPWPTPNLVKTYQHLSWKPKGDLIKGLGYTLEYLKTHKREAFVVEKEIKQQLDFLKDPKSEERVEKLDKKEEKETKEKRVKKDYNFGRKIWVGLGIGAIFLGLVFPVVTMAYGVGTIVYDLGQAQSYLLKGDFIEAQKRVNNSQIKVGEVGQIVESIGAIKPPFEVMEILEILVQSAGLSIDATDNLYKTLAIISGQSEGSPKDSSQAAFSKYQQAISSIDTVIGIIDDKDSVINKLPEDIKTQIKDRLLSSRKELIQATAVSHLVSEVASGKGEYHYLVVLGDSSISRPAGGVVRAVADLEFVDGSIKGVEGYSASEIDRKLSSQIQPPTELKKYGQTTSWLTKDIGTEADLGSTASTVKTFYNKALGENLVGVIMVDERFLSGLMKITGPVNIESTGVVVTQENFLERLRDSSDPEVLSRDVLKESLKRFIYSEHKDIKTLSGLVSQGSLDHSLGVVIFNTKSASLLQSAGLAGTSLSENKTGQGINDLTIGLFEMNLSEGFIKREQSWEIGLNKGGAESLKLRLKLENTSDSNYSGIFKIYLPSRFKLKEGNVSNFSDYNRAGFIAVAEVLSGKRSEIEISFESSEVLKEGQQRFNIKLLKQPGVLDEKAFLKVNLSKEIKLQSSDLQELGFLGEFGQDIDKYFIASIK